MAKKGEAVNGWVETPKSLAYTDEVDASVTSVGQTNLTIECIARNCCRLFATNNEMRRHVRIYHDPTCNSTDQDKKK